jgi:Tol biopolymer transport system component
MNPAPSSSAVASPSSNPTPAEFCSAAHRCLALVTLRGSNQIVIRDVTDINHPTTVTRLGAVPWPQFVSASQLSYVDGQKLIRVPLAGSPKTTVATLPSSQWMLVSTWSPDGSTAAYVANGDTKSELRTVTGAANQSFASMGPFNGGCETRSCGDGSDFKLSFSPDGNYISMMQDWGGPNFLLWTADRKPVTTHQPAGSSYHMSVWSGNSLYFVDASGVVVWRNGQLSTFLPGVRWLRPKGSPDGGRIVYMTRDAKSLGHIWVVDTATRKVSELKSSRAEPAFLTPRYVWYKGQGACNTSAPDCYVDFPVADTGTTYIYDLQTGIESQSIITQVYDAWPHAA